MSRIGICFCTVMIAVGFMIPFGSSIAAQKKPASLRSGHDVFMDRCAVCHGEDGKGNGPAVGSLKIAPADLTLLTRRSGGNFPEERVKQIVGQQVDISAHGSREMPIWGDLFHAKTPADQQAANDRFKALVSYLESIQE